LQSVSPSGRRSKRNNATIALSLPALNADKKKYIYKYSAKDAGLANEKCYLYMQLLFFGAAVH